MRVDFILKFYKLIEQGEYYGLSNLQNTSKES